MGILVDVRRCSRALAKSAHQRWVRSFVLPLNVRLRIDGLRGLMDHWNRKHAKAVYVPSLSRNPPPEYWYGSIVQLCEETDFLLFLLAVAHGAVFYYPGIKVEGAATARPVVKRRSQFLVAHQSIGALYRNHTHLDLS